MEPIAIRYAIQNDERDDKALSFVKSFEKHLVIRHAPDDDDKRDHWHAIIWTDKTEQNVRTTMKNKVPGITGNKTYSVKAKVESRMDEQYRYLCHSTGEGHEVQVLSSTLAFVTPEWCKQQNAAFYKARREFKKDIKKRVSVVEECEDRAKANGIKSFRGIASIMLDVYADRKKAINTHHVKAQVRTIWLRLNGECAKPCLLDEICGPSGSYWTVEPTGKPTHHMIAGRKVCDINFEESNEVAVTSRLQPEVASGFRAAGAAELISNDESTQEVQLIQNGLHVPIRYRYQHQAQGHPSQAPSQEEGDDSVSSSGSSDTCCFTESFTDGYSSC